MKRVLSLLLLIWACVFADTQPLQAVKATAVVQRSDSRPWPRRYSVNGTEFLLLRPELDSWNKDQLFARAVMGVKTSSAAAPYRYGVVWLKARTETDIQGRLVSISDLVVTDANFPSNKDQE